ncbi:helix-turn-helix transcriptional regulator [Leptospira santarosai]|uniref:DNA-binding helix-turn-helix protein n=1 Tax=Leptospira santarosai serovar Arenal str. MAVJ 401 TaxID=1049976 RepID=M6K5U5_9LEPT|nr:helix-turn-helix transcriptional regulator [Leptospira santarosai]EKS07691.1 DNA-binding helix-turn-helix protein [Leptospira santarosai str. JET]EMN23082.1 DNA-binding helix-turn-helix protein [Leptospira santarosai serovar Arenal str. MAVJ 401]MDI7226785.1 helix-turn-helix transcriptional regulator [Leptospira santarosai]
MKNALRTFAQDDDASVRFREGEFWKDTEFFKENKEFLQPGSKMKYYRKKAGLSLSELGEKLGGVPRQNLSAMELGKRPISKELAKQLSKMFKKPVEIFLYAE